jgi:hypothetical protein
LAIPSGQVHGSLVVELLCLHRATTIVLDLNSYGNYSTILRVPAGIEFPALETLSLSSCTTNFDALLSCCSRLRTLRLADVWFHKGILRVNSPLLQDLVVTCVAWINHVNIVAPGLTQLTMSLHTNQEVYISILAPRMDKVLWDCYFSRQPRKFGLWQLEQLSLQAAERQRQTPSLHIHANICVPCPANLL